jgi:tetratricopeptide (TPR) repeat protein
VVEQGAFSAFVEQLSGAIQDRELAIFCGAGISLRSGLPLVRDFVTSVLSELDAAAEDQRAILDSPLPFEAFVQVLDESSDISRLLAIFDLGSPNATHVWLAELARAGYVRTLCTTNFDALIEQALERLGLVRGRDFEVLYRDEDLGRIRADDGKIRVIKIHGSVDDKPGMAITLRQVAGRTLSEARRQVIDAVFASESHRSVLVLGYSCSDLFDISPQIEAIAASHRRVILVDHRRDQAELRSLAERREKNPFHAFPAGDWVLCDTDSLIAELRRVGSMPETADNAVERAEPTPWREHVAAWAREADAKHPGMAKPTLLGELCYKISAFERGAHHYARALDAARAAGHRQREGIYLGNLANNERALGRLELAAEHFEAAIAIARELGDEEREGMWLTNLGGSLADAGAHERAISVLEQALGIATARADLTGQAYCLGNLGHSLHLTARYEDAAAHYRRGLAIARELGDKVAEASLVGSIGNSYHRLGRYREALAHHEQALAHAREVAARAAEAEWLAKIANDLVALGEIPRAIEHLERAILLAHGIGDRSSEANRLGELGNVYQAQNELAKAKEPYERALAIAREIGHARLAGTCLGNLGNVLLGEGRLADAVSHYEQALEVAVRAGDRQLESTWLGNLSAAHHVAGEYRRAIELQRRALALANAIADPKRIAEAELNLGSGLLALGNSVEAASLFHHALALFSELFGPEHEHARLARTRLAELEPAATPSLYWLQLGNDLFELYAAGGKRIIPVFASAETAERVRELLDRRFPGALGVAQGVGVPRERFEAAVLADGTPADQYLFMYEDTPEFPRFLEGLETYARSG